MKIQKMMLMLLTLLLMACHQQGNVDNVSDCEGMISNIYTDEDIEDAMICVKNYFKINFDGCTLLTISYVGDRYEDQFIEYATKYESDEAIILTSSFETNEYGGDGSLNPNETYEDWQWILIRDENDEWIHVDHGY